MKSETYDRVVKQLYRRNKEDVAQWLINYLLQMKCDPEFQVPSRYAGPVPYLLDVLDSYSDNKLLMHFGDSVHAALVSALTTGQALSPSSGNVNLLYDLLYLLDSMTVSDSANLANLLIGLLVTGSYRKQPAAGKDCHALLLYNLASHLKPDPSRYYSIKTQLQPEIEDADYAGAAFSVLCQISPELCANDLPIVLKTQEQASVPSINLLFDFVASVGRDPNYWQETSRKLLGRIEFSYIQEIRATLAQLEYDQAVRAIDDVISERRTYSSLLKIDQPIFDIMVGNLSNDVLSSYSPELSTIFSRGMIEDYIPRNYNNFLALPANHFAHLLSGLLKHLNGRDKEQIIEDRSTLGKHIGQRISSLVRQNELDSTRSDKAVRCWINAANLDEHSRTSLLGAHCLRSRTMESVRALNGDSLAFSKTKYLNDLESEFGTILDGGILDSVSAVVQSFHDARQEGYYKDHHVTFGRGPFHEDRQYAAVLKALFNVEGFDRFKIIDSPWGGFGRDISVAIMHKERGNKLRALIGPDLYRFRGYYLFAQKSWLNSLSTRYQAKLPRVVANLIDELTSSGHSDVNNGIDNAKARAWLCLSCQSLERALGYKDFFNMIRDIFDKPEKIPKLGSCSAQQTEPDDSFETFICGKADTYAGGAIHSRLIKRWWCHEDSGNFIVELLNPTHFDLLIGEDWSRMNVVAFNRQSATSESPLTESLGDLFVEVGKAIAEVTKTMKDGSDAPYSALRRLLLEALSPKEDPNTFWSFITDKDDLPALVLKDNDYVR